MNPETEALVAAQITAGILASDTYELQQHVTKDAEFAVGLFKAVHAELQRGSPDLAPSHPQP